MRSLGYKAIDLLVSHFASIPEKKRVALATRKQMDELLGEGIPETGSHVDDVLEHNGLLAGHDRVAHAHDFR